ncbi:MAG TPA: phosphoribosyltransferase [Bacillota bacterium]|nr:phosphoribosyltransferase [Bacillota bacterium]
MPESYRSFRRAAAPLILDPEGVHHGFARGTHGRKLNFDLIEEGTPLYDRWIRLQAGLIRARVLDVAAAGLVLVGVASGTNRLARDVGSELGLEYLTTRKTSPSSVELDDESVQKASETFFRRALVVEDVGITGGTALTAAISTRAHSANTDIPVRGLFSWIRTDTLTPLDEADMPYWAIIHDPQPTYSPEICAQMGYCAFGWELVPHGGAEQTF